MPHRDRSEQTIEVVTPVRPGGRDRYPISPSARVTVRSVVCADGNLSRVYREVYRASGADLVVFKHDDAWIRDWADFERQLWEVVDRCPVVGVAGAANFDPAVPAWWEQPATRGSVAHPDERGGWRTRAYGPAGPAAVLDGVVLAVRRKWPDGRGPLGAATADRLADCWDDRFGRHFYDIAFSLAVTRMFLATGPGPGCWAIVCDVAHDSGGPTGPEWREAAARFLSVIGGQGPVRTDPSVSPQELVHQGSMHHQAGRFHDAEVLYRRALSLDPGYADALHLLGMIALEARQFPAAVELIERALQRSPENAGFRNNLGTVHEAAGQLARAVECFDAALRTRPGYAAALHNRAETFKAWGRLPDALASYREALRADPDFAQGRHSYLATLLYDPSAGPAEILAEHRRWGPPPGQTPNPLPHAQEPNPDRKLRIGYVSPDFRTHAVMRFFEPILEHHDRDRFEIYLYAELRGGDEVTGRIRRLGHAWRPTFGRSAAEMADAIRADGIDILVDLAGHTRHNRLDAFPHRPAPVQGTYLGYPATTGTPGVDFRITDAILDPDGDPPSATEELVRLSGAFFCFRPPLGAPPVAPPPFRSAGQMTFGSHHPPVKLNATVFSLWKRILDDVPDSRLLLFRSNLPPDAEQELTRGLTAAGITRDRFAFRSPGVREPDYLAVYAEIDVLLDTLPFTGHTMTCEALWMGVPVVTLRGNRASGRLSASTLDTLGATDWIAETPDEYVAIAVRLTRDPSRLADLRSQLRGRVSEKLTDGPGFSRSLEAAYRALWKRWCQQAAPAIPVLLRSASPEELHRRGMMLARDWKFAEAEKLFSEAVEIDPGFVSGYLALGMCRKNQCLFTDAIAAYQRGLDRAPGDPALLSNLASALEQLHRFAEARRCLAEAVRHSPIHGYAWHNHLLALNYDPDAPPDEVFEAHQAWGQRVGAVPVRTYPNLPDPGRKLRVGYVSSELCRHPAIRMFEPIAANYDRNRFEIYLYTEVPEPDDDSRRLAGYAAGWRSTVGKSAAQVADLVRADGIDILVDLVGHFSGSRLDVLAEAAAPVQASFLSYPNTTGLPAVGFRISDRTIDPPELPARTVERIAYLPGCFTAFHPPENAPDVAPPPCLRNGSVTFGSNQSLIKLNAEVFALWARVLDAVPGSRLLFSRSSHRPPVAALLRGWLAEFGVEQARVEVRDPPYDDAGYLSQYADVDLFLDTFPYSGHTMIFESLWQGVPVVTLCGATPAGRVAGSVLRSVGHPELVAANREEYVRTAVRWASDPAALARFRSEIREQMRATVCDGLRFTRDFEAVLRELWGDWCRSQTTPASKPAETFLSILHPSHRSTSGTTHALEPASRHPNSLAISPRADDAEGWFTFAESERQAGRHDAAESAYRRAVCLDPERGEYQLGLARLLRGQGRIPEAIVGLGHAARLRPDRPEPLHELGMVHFDLGQSAQAIDLLRRASDRSPGSANILCDLGNALRVAHKTEESLACYSRALDLDPRCFPALANLATARAEEGRTRDARELYGRATAIRPIGRLRIAAETVLPIVYESQEHLRSSREQFAEGVRRLEADGVRIDPTQEQMPTHFYLAYHGENDRELHAALARLAGPTRDFVSPRSGPVGRRIRVGFVSRYLRNHTIGQLNHGLIARLDRKRFEVVVLSIGPADDETGRRIRESADEYAVLPTAVPGSLRPIAEAKLDLLYYPDVGMDAVGYTLGFHRFAPVQVASWGHPVTTGLPAMDAFLTTGDLDPPGNEAHYTETPVRLPRLNVCYERPRLDGAAKNRAAFGLPTDATIYVCPQTLFKFHPEFDALLAAILRADPRGLLVAIEGNHPHWTQLLRSRWTRVMPDVVGRMRFVPKVARNDFLALLACSDVMLDPIHFGGGNTSYEALSLGLPIVTWPSAFLRGRLTSAMYRQMGVSEFVAGSADEYVRFAVRLGTDRDYRLRSRQNLAEAAGSLFEDDEAVDAVADSFESLFERQRSKNTPPT